MRFRRPLAAAPVLPLLAALACHEAAPRPAAGDFGGTMVIAVGGDADALFPPLTINSTSFEVDGLLFENLAEPDKTLNPVGDQGWIGELADSWTWGPDSLSIAFHLDPRARWHDGVSVRASDVRFTYQLYVDPRVGSSVGPLLDKIDSVTVADSVTAVFWFRTHYPTEFYDAAYQMRILPEHLLATADRTQLQSSDFGRHPVGSGPYRFVRWVPQQTIELQADTAYHRGRPHLDRIIWSIAPEYSTTVVRLLAGDADFLEYVQPPDVPRVTQRPDLKLVSYPSMAYAYLLFNERDPRDPSRPNALFADRDVRRALTMAVDRATLTRSVFDSLAQVALGPYPRALPSSDSTVPELPFAADSARRILDARGWRVGAGGVRVKNGRPLRFSMLVPSSSSVRLKTAVLLQSMFHDIGVQADIEKVDMGTFRQRNDARQFETAIEAMQSDGNPSSILQGWGVDAARARDGGNVGSYENPAFDALIDSAMTQFDVTRAHDYYRRAYALLNQDAPGIWLWEPFTIAAVHRRIQPVGMRADQWFANIPEWYIPASQRIARDQIGLADARP